MRCWWGWLSVRQLDRPCGLTSERVQWAVSCRSPAEHTPRNGQVSRLASRSAIADGCAIPSHRRAKRTTIVRRHQARTLPPKKSKPLRQGECRHRNRRMPRRRHIVLRRPWARTGVEPRFQTSGLARMVQSSQHHTDEPQCLKVGRKRTFAESQKSGLLWRWGPVSLRCAACGRDKHSCCERGDAATRRWIDRRHGLDPGTGCLARSNTETVGRPRIRSGVTVGAAEEPLRRLRRHLPCKCRRG
jgi:hypothetical protein